MAVKELLRKVLGNANERELRRMQPLVDAINGLEREYEELSDAELRAKTDEFLRRLEGGETLDDLLVEAFAAVREASKRTIGLRHYDVQLLGGIALHRGYVVEMKTGEGKTLVATLPLYLNALTGRGVHLVTVNDYLARRDVQWMGPIYHALGVSVGLLQQGQDHSFVYDPEYERGERDYYHLRPVHRREAYAAHITYGTNSEFGFDYLRDNSVYSLDDMVQRGFYYAIVDEVDNILIDEARTPLIISGPATEPTDEYYLLARVVRQLSPEDYEIDERTRSVSLTDAGYDHVERLLNTSLFDPDHPEEMTPQQARLLHHLEQALKAEYIMQRNRDYIVQGQRVVIVDEFTGRLMPGRRWSDGLHQAVEAKEGVPIRRENITYATITLQNYFRMYEKLAGMTGTAATEAEEFEKIYNLRVLVLPTHRPVIREDYPDTILRTQEAKFRAVVQDIVTTHCLGRPVLVGTTSVAVSEHLSNRLSDDMVRRWASVLLIRNHLDYNGVDNATYKKVLKELSTPLESLSPSQLRKIGEKVGISPQPTAGDNLERLADLLGIEDRLALSKVLRQGVPHNVLNARRHTEEARIVARAGESGAVTIATNMAGRGVDIKLGGELDEETIAQVRRVLRQSGVDPYGMSLEEMAQVLQDMDPDDYYLYRDAVTSFLRHVADEKRVKELGGLHVIGTERHEARRIDNQLRGRAGRQGDPGSSRFYISLEDDLMRRFGGSKAAQLAARLGAEDDMPISLKIVSQAIANAQTQVEGYNFDIRKHLLEYDDVLNTQREVIYEQRRRILSKPDLRDDVWEMVEDEIGRHIDAAWSKDPPDLVHLMAYLERVQPTTAVAEGRLFPSFTLKYVLSTLPVGSSPAEMRAAIEETVRQALVSERRYLLAQAEQVMNRILEQQDEITDRLLDAASIAYEGAEMEAEEAGRELDPRGVVQAIKESVGLELDPTPLRKLRGRKLERAVMDMVREAARLNTRLRALSAVQKRAGIEWRIQKAVLTDTGDHEFVEAVSGALEKMMAQGAEKTAEEVANELQTRLRRPDDCTAPAVMHLLERLRFGTRTGFDRRHRKVSQQVERFRFTCWVAEQLAGRDREWLERAILDHLREAIEAWEDAWGGLEMQRISSHPLAELDEETRAGLRKVLGDARFDELANVRVADLPPQDAQRVREYLGERVLFNVQRQLMLDITGRYWVEHLTAMEELRQGIGLQSYAQKDPLAEYKVRAYEMFQNLLQAIRSDVVSAMFTYRPHDLSQVRVGVERKKRVRSTPAERPPRHKKSRRRKRRR